MRQRKPQAAPEALRNDERLTMGPSFPEPVAVVGGLFLLVGMISGSVTLTVVSAAILAVVLVARLWATLALRRVAISRQLSAASALAGDVVEVTLVVENRKVMPLPWLRLDFMVPDGLLIGTTSFSDQDGFNTEFRRSFHETHSLARFERVRAVRAVRVGRRGCYRLGALSLESGDLFGFFTTRATTLTHPDELVVYPRPQALPGFTLPSRIPSGEHRGRDPLHEDVSRPRGLREYLSGDAVSRIDWKRTAKMRTPLVRTFDPSDSHQVVILLECETADLAWQLRPMRLEAAAAAGASVAMLASEQGYRFGLITNGLSLASGRPVLRPAAGQAQFEHLMQTLARIQPRPPMALDDLLGHDIARPWITARGSTFVYVTPTIKPATMAWLAARVAAGAEARCLYVGGGPTPAGLASVPVEDFSEQFRFDEAPAGSAGESGFHA